MRSLSIPLPVNTFKDLDSNKNNFEKNVIEKELEYVKKIDIEKFVLKLKSQLKQKGYFWPEDKVESLNLNIDNLFHNLKLTRPNLKTLFGIIKNLDKKK